MENRDQKIDQLLKGVYRICADKDDCFDCPFYTSTCVFDGEKPRTWFEEKKPVEVKPEPVKETPAAKEVDFPPVEKDTDTGTWLVSTTMGGVLTKYVYICSKCGYKKESYLSIPPTSFCPECEKKKQTQE